MQSITEKRLNGWTGVSGKLIRKKEKWSRYAQVWKGILCAAQHDSHCSSTEHAEVCGCPLTQFAVVNV